MPAGYVYTWTGHVSTNFGTAGNWFNSTTGTNGSGVPGGNDEALISAGGSITGTGNVFELGLTGTGSGLSIAGQLAGGYLFEAGSVGVASGGSLSFSNLVEIGDYSSSVIGHSPGTLTVNAGGLLRSTLPTTGDFDITVGRDGGTGTLNVTGQGALADASARGFDVGDDGNGLIAVSSGGHMTGGTGDAYQSGVATQLGIALGSPGGNGTLTVTGAGSGASFGDLVDVGFGGTGSLAVSSGATLTAGDGNAALNIGDFNSTGGNGTVSLAGGDGTLDGFTEVGAYGAGSLLLSAGATLTMSETSNAGNNPYWSALLGITSGVSGTLSVGSGSTLITGHGLGVGVAGHGELDIGGNAEISSPTGGTALSLDAGIDAGASGVVNVTGGMFKDVDGTGLVIGANGSGTLNVNAGGQVLGGGLTLGESSGSSGTLNVSGAGASLTSTGQLQVGSDGAGSLSIGPGGSVTAGTAGSTLGFVVAAAGGSGSATIAGGSLDVTGQIGVGIDGLASLLVSSGATVVATSSGIPALEVGNTSGTTGSVTVTGAGTSITLLGGLTDGGSYSGSFALTGGAHASISSPSPNTLPSLTIAAFAGTSAMTVDGAGTVLNDSGQMLVGGTGTGAGNLTVSGGATLSVANASGQSIQDAIIGAGTGTITSVATVTGSGSALDVAGALLVGDNDRGSLNIAAGGHVVSNSLTVSSANGGVGSLTISGAGSTLSTDALQVGTTKIAGTASIAGGTISVTGNTGVHGGVVLSLGGTFAATGAIAVNAGSTITGQGTVDCAQIIDLGRLGVNGGVMTCIGPITGTGLISVAGGGDFIIHNAEASSVGLVFGNNGTFTAASINDISGTIAGWESNDAIDFTGAQIASDSLSGNTLSLFNSTGKLLGREVFAAGSVASHNFTLTADQGSGTLLKYHS
jgi:T5SS/PEP-CTERM-associated repeat protein